MHIMPTAKQLKVTISALFYALLIASTDGDAVKFGGTKNPIEDCQKKDRVMSVPAIQTALQQMQAMKTEVAAPATQVNLNVQPGAQAGSFAGELKNSIDRINTLQQTAAANTTAFQLGDPNVSLNQVMVDKQKAGLAFEMGVQVRNKLVSAYKDIMNMQV